ncbi:MAG: response regulator [Anaerolineales bacterium]|nr:response regulator [Anaerolineales bacterium]
MANETILIVEDNDMLRDGLCEMLAYEGFNVLTARNGQAGLDQLKNRAPALIVSDVTMPIMNGYEFYNAVRARPEWTTIPFIFLTARSEPADIRVSRNLGADDYLTKPISREELVSTIRSRLNRFHQVQMAQLQRAYQASLTALANAIEMRDPESSGHVERVTSYSLLLADYLGWHHSRIEQLRFGAILHDVGKIHIPQAILRKNGPLSEQEWALIRRHPVTGAEMSKNIPFLAEAIPIILHHHEHWNGAGYPHGLAGKAIPEGAQIVAVADAFDSMTTPRPYSTRLAPMQALEEILRLAGERYDPTIIIAFQSAWDDGKIQHILDSLPQSS